MKRNRHYWGKDMSKVLEFLKDKRITLIIIAVLLFALAIIPAYVLSEKINDPVLRILNISVLYLAIVIFTFGLFCNEQTNLKLFCIRCIILPFIMIMMLWFTSLFFNFNNTRSINLVCVLIGISLPYFIELSNKNNKNI